MTQPQDRVVSPVGSTLEPEIKQASILDQFKAPVKVIPSHLVILDAGKTEEYFIATKFDDQNVNWAKFVGFYLVPQKVPFDFYDIRSKHAEIISETEAGKFMEVIFPWGRIKSVRSLMYKHKTISK